MPSRLLLVAGAVAGLAAAAVVTLVQDSTYRADASIVLVREGRPPGNDPKLAAAAEAAAKLFESRAVAASAIANLGLEQSPDELVGRLDAAAEPESSLVRLRVEAPSREEARRTAQEAAEVATVLFNDRFGPATVASVWEPASADGDRVSPKPARNLAVGALLGALAGWALLLLASRGPRLARPSGRTVPALVPDAVPGPVPAPPPPAEGPFELPAFGEWTVGDVERLVAEQGPSFPERREELENYVDAFRSVAGPGGRLPGDVELVVEDVFAELIARAGSSRRRS